MRIRGIVAAALLLAALAAAAPAHAQGQGNAARGKEKAEQCFGCHGETGNSTMPLVPSLAGQPPAYTFLQLFLFREKLRNVPTMTPFMEGKTDDDLNDFAAYFASQKLEPDPEPRDEARYKKGAELSQRLRPAVERIRSPQRGDFVGRVLERELDNVQRTLDGTDRGAYGRAVTALSARSRRVFVLSGDASGGIARHGALELAMLREGVCLIEGNEVAVLRHIATAARGDACLAIDLRRYDRWVVATAVELQSRGVHLVVLTDSALSPLADVAEATFSISAESEGPFDSHVGTLALLNALIAGVADRLRRTATERLDRVEDEWRRAGALVGPSGR